MNIGQMFAKSINREIKPVVKPGQVDDAFYSGNGASCGIDFAVRK